MSLSLLGRIGSWFRVTRWSELPNAETMAVGTAAVQQDVDWSAPDPGDDREVRIVVRTQDGSREWRHFRACAPDSPDRESTWYELSVPKTICVPQSMCFSPSFADLPNAQTVPHGTLGFVQAGDEMGMFICADRRWIPVVMDQPRLDFDLVVAQEAPVSKNAPPSVSTQPTVPPATLSDRLRDDAQDAAWRTAGSQLTKLVRDPLAALLARHLGPEDEALRARISNFLGTELGSAMVSAMLSAGIATLPLEDGVASKLGRELRVRALSGTADVLVELVSGPLRQVMATTLKGVPAAPAEPQALGDGQGHGRVVEAPVMDEEREAR